MPVNLIIGKSDKATPSWISRFATYLHKLFIKIIYFCRKFASNLGFASNTRDFSSQYICLETGFEPRTVHLNNNGLTSMRPKILLFSFIRAFEEDLTESKRNSILILSANRRHLSAFFLVSIRFNWRLNLWIFNASCR